MIPSSEEIFSCGILIGLASTASILAHNLEINSDSHACSQACSHDSLHVWQLDVTYALRATFFFSGFARTGASASALMRLRLRFANRGRPFARYASALILELMSSCLAVPRRFWSRGAKQAIGVYRSAGATDDFAALACQQGCFLPY